MKQKGHARYRLVLGFAPIIILTLIVLVLAGYFGYKNYQLRKRITQNTASPPISDNACNINNDCTIGIQPTKCCACPQAVNNNVIGTKGWESYVPNKDYSKVSKCETFIACKPCQIPTISVCQDSFCIFQNQQFDNQSITQQEINQGWYWGTENQKKPNTPASWIYTEAGRSSCWHEPNTSCIPK